MAYAVGIYSTMVIPDEGLVALFERLGGVPSQYGWSLTRGEATIEIETAHEELPDGIPPDKMKAITRELGATPRSKLVILWMADHDGFEARMARAVARALSELYTIVFDDNFGSITGMRPASIAGED